MADVRHIAIVASFMSPGVALGAGGFVIVGGKLKKIPPRGIKQLQSAAQLIQASQLLGRSALARSVQAEGIKMAEKAVLG